MNKKRPSQNAITAGNWPLVIMGGLVISLSAVLLVVVVMFAHRLGWAWSVLISAGAISSIGLSTVSIYENDPSWLLVGLLFSR